MCGAHFCIYLEEMMNGLFLVGEGSQPSCEGQASTYQPQPFLYRQAYSQMSGLPSSFSFPSSSPQMYELDFISIFDEKRETQRILVTCQGHAAHKWEGEGENSGNVASEISPRRHAMPPFQGPPRSLILPATPQRLTLTGHCCLPLTSCCGCSSLPRASRG